jgi:hypothetical protein
MNRTTSFTRRLALLSAGTVFTLGGLAGSAFAVDEIANPEPDCQPDIQFCGDKGPDDPQPEPDDNGLDLPGDITDDPCNHLSHGCETDTPDPGIDEVGPEAPVPADPTFTG